MGKLDFHKISLQIAVCTSLALAPITVHAAPHHPEESSAGAIRYAYTPLVLEDSSYVSLVTPADQKTVNTRLAAEMARIHKKFAQGINTPLKLSVGVKLLPKNDFFKETGAPRWTNAMFYRNEILVPVQNFNNINWEKLNKTLKHEYTHAVTYALTAGSCPAWIDEGLAQIIEDADTSILKRSLRVWLKDEQTIPLKHLNQGFTKLKLDAVGPAYAQSKAAVALLLGREDGVNRLFKLIQLTRYLSVDKAFGLVYEQSLSEFESELSRKLRQSDARHALLGRSDSSLVF